MEFHVRAHSVDIDQATRVYAEEKIGRTVEKFLGNTGRVDVEVTEIARGSGPHLARVKVHVAIPHAPSQTVHVDDSEIRAAIDLCSDKVARAIKRSKQKRRSKARSGQFPALKPMVDHGDESSEP
ncbi:MAG: ribosome-associated translation inhibitor RaiA [Myxococcota bacterium]|nr:ribosome-associated translation inhibitor RaiA [Myxococcota bacterium]